MKADHHQIPRESLIWIIIAQVVCVLPHISHVTPWVFVAAFCCVVWRVLIYQGRVSYPKPKVRSGIAIFGLLFIMSQYREIYSLEPALVLLIATYFLKLIELYRTKDAYVILFLSYFIIATEFIYSTQILGIIYLVVSFSTVTGALIALNRSQTNQRSRDTILAAIKLSMLCIPFALILFVFFPRIPPLWALDMSASNASIGLSEQMSPGDISNLGKSSKLAFRAEFLGDIPPREKLYWRTMVFSEFDGRTWSKSKNVVPQDQFWRAELNSSKIRSKVKPLGRSVTYRVSLQPTNYRELVSLQMPVVFDPSVAMLSNFTLVKEKPVKSFFSYEMTSAMDYVLESRLEPRIYHRELQLPVGVNPTTKDYATRLFRALDKDPNAMIQYLLNKFHTEEFAYTLKPPLMGKHSIDDFLFTHRKGFCGHYAGAFVFLLRSVGIPARVIGGYHGGEVNPFGNYVLVHQFDAHAWTEVWLKGQGWVSIDPTAYVAPERIEYGLEDALGSEEFLEDTIFSVVKYKGNSFLNQLRFKWDYLNHTWNKRVMNYDESAQFELLSNTFGLKSATGMMLTATFIIMAVFGIVGLYYLMVNKRKINNRLDYRYMSWCAALSSEQLERKNGETPRAYLARLKTSHLEPAQIDAAIEITQLYEALRYRRLGAKEKVAEQKQAFARLTKAFARKLSADKTKRIFTKPIF